MTVLYGYGGLLIDVRNQVRVLKGFFPLISTWKSIANFSSIYVDIISITNIEKCQVSINIVLVSDRFEKLVSGLTSTVFVL